MLAWCPRCQQLVSVVSYNIRGAMSMRVVKECSKCFTILETVEKVRRSKDVQDSDKKDGSARLSWR